MLFKVVITFDSGNEIHSTTLELVDLGTCINFLHNYLDVKQDNTYSIQFQQLLDIKLLVDIQTEFITLPLQEKKKRKKFKKIILYIND